MVFDASRTIDKEAQVYNGFANNCNERGKKAESKGESENDSASNLRSFKSTQTSRMNQKSLRLFEMIVFANLYEHREER